MHEIASQRIKREKYGERTKLTLPYRAQLNAARSHGDVILGIIIFVVGNSVGAFILVDLWQQRRAGQELDAISLIASSLIIAITMLGLIAYRFQLNYLRSGKTFSWVFVGREQIIIQEAVPIRLRSFTWDALKICRMRIAQLPKRFEMPEEAICPSFWNIKAIQQSGQMALLAQDENGRFLYPIAVGYPKHVLLELASELQKLLDTERREHWRNVVSVRPDLPQDIDFPLVPVIGDRGQSLPLSQKLPSSSQIAVRQTDSSIEIKVPWSSAFEELTFRANSKGLNIKRKTLLGEINISIPPDRLIELSVYPIDSQDDGDMAYLKISFASSELSDVVNLELLREFSYAEVCWVGWQLSRYTPCPSTSISLKPRRGFQFGILQLLLLTAWVAIASACIYIDLAWGWLYALQIIVFLMIGGTMLGYRPLGQPANRSWTGFEIGLAFIILGCLWMLRLMSLFST